MSDGDACNAFHVENQYRLYILSSLKKKGEKNWRNIPYLFFFVLHFILFIFLDILY